LSAGRVIDCLFFLVEYGSTPLAKKTFHPQRCGLISMSSVQNSRPHKRSMAGSRVYLTEEFARLGAA
jgi:hypothetical protein